MPAPDFREKLLAGLGGDWPKPCPLNVRHRETIQKPGYLIESLYYDAEPNDPIPAMLLVPDGVKANNPAPAVADEAPAEAGPAGIKPDVNMLLPIASINLAP